MTLAPWDLSRLVVTVSGDLKATFSDGLILVLSRNAERFNIVFPDGRVVQQLTRFALSQHRARLAVALEFCNLHLDRAPTLTKVTAGDLLCSFSIGTAIHSVQWPTSLAAACQSGLLRTQGCSGTQVEAEGSTARLVLHPHKQRIAVCYPCMTMQDADISCYNYVWHTQLFSCSEVPQRWQAAWLLACAASLEPHSADAGQDVEPSSQDGDGKDSAPGLATQSQNASRTSLLPSAAQQTQAPDHALLPPSKDPWWHDCSTTLLPSLDVVHFEWTPEATYQFIQETQEVEAWIHHDESCLRTTQQGKFLCHHRTSGAATYAADTVPSHVWDSQGQLAYALAPVASHACMLREVCCALCKKAKHQQLDTPLDSHEQRSTDWSHDQNMKQARGASDMVATQQAAWERAPAIPCGSPSLSVEVRGGDQHDIASLFSASDPGSVRVTDRQRAELVEACLARNARMLAMLA